MIKKVLSASVLTFTLLVTSLPVYAEEVETESTESAEYIAEQLGGEAITEDELPEGVVPIEFDTVEEAKEYLEEQESLIDDAVNDLEENTDESLNSLRKRGFSASERGVLTAKFITGLDALNVYVNYTYGDSKFISVDSVTTSHTGVTIGNEWNLDTYTYYYGANGRRLYLTIYGHWDHYILVNSSLTRIGSDKKEYSTSWYK